ncbi:hypothetical protein P8452_18093 [Trifolium repens]|nr:hypothetical protein P8452_18093 [Trifolium repens]
MKLQKKYCTPGEPCVGLKKSKVGDPVPVKTKGAPKKPKPGAKKQKHCQNCNSTTHPAMNCSLNPKATAEEDVNSVSVTESLSQVQKKTKRKPVRDVGSSRAKHCPRQPQSESGSARTNRGMDVSSTQVTPMFAGQPPIPVVQPVYPMFGTSTGESSKLSYGSLEQVMKFGRAN